MTCPRCFGLMLPERDRHGAYRTCMACGWVSYPEPPEDYIPDRGRRKSERLRGRPKREPYRKEAKAFVIGREAR